MPTPIEKTLNWEKWLFKLIVQPIARISHRLRYKLSDGLSWVLENVIRYRKKVIDGNLKLAFPEKSGAERDKIRREFYRSFADIILEQTWMFTATDEDIQKNIHVANPEIFERFKAEGRPIVIVAGHVNNYEMVGTAIPTYVGIPGAAVYAPLRNAYFDKRLRETRSRFGLSLWPVKEVRKRLAAWKDRRESFVLGFLSDQSPQASRNKFWVPFFGRPTAVFSGLERYSRELGAAVLHGTVSRTARGCYRVELELITPDGSQTAPGFIMRRQAELLEKYIKSDPPSWLWSHQRWKLSYPEHRIEGDEVYLDGLYNSDENLA